mgnify:CR=1 FL=1
MIEHNILVVVKYNSHPLTYTHVHADQRRAEALKLRVIEHNVLVVAKYYSDISMQRLSQLLDLSLDDVSRLNPLCHC